MRIHANATIADANKAIQAIKSLHQDSGSASDFRSAPSGQPPCRGARCRCTARATWLAVHRSGDIAAGAAADAPRDPAGTPPTILKSRFETDMEGGHAGTRTGG